ncbi:MAG: serine/threonine protein kinase, partial [Anaerolineae bacterium]|nr:serine/threonine protein kinase [Anaerolineae bacterium]
MGIQNLAGQTLGPYELRELLGIGGMGVVYRAYQHNLARTVAVKILSQDLAKQPGYLERFNREACTSAALEHPHIVSIFDYGTQRNISYLVMQLLTGGALSDRLEQAIGTDKPLPSLGEISGVIKQLSSALDYAHSAGVIHRDIKPSNVMFDNHGNACLVDFGIAKMAESTQGLTATGVTIGTWGFMAPEQWRAEKLSPATDQYALGIMTYAMLTGQMPFEAQTPAGVMHKHLNEAPAPPHIKRDDLPEMLSVVIERALAKSPRDRFPTCTAFAQAFDGAIRGQTGERTAFFTAPVELRKAEPSLFAASPSSGGSGTMTGETRPMYRQPLFWGMGRLILIMAVVIGLL